MGAYDPRGRDTVVALARILRHLGISFGVLKKEKCTGDAARRLGNDLVFQQLAAFNIDQLTKAGARRLLSICPHCVQTIGQDWRECGARFEIEHHTALLARHAARLPKPEPVVFHDPCYLGRYQKGFDAPRQLLRVIEPGRTRETSFCCGAGGGQFFLGEEQGTRISQIRAGELAAVAPTTATACPFCRSMLGDAAPERPTADVAQLIAAELKD
jgi:Fe-S oxidoreductase